MTTVQALRLAAEIGAELWQEWRRDRARAKAAQQWAETPASVRACPRCREVAYTPGQAHCTKCGSALNGR